MHLFSYVLSRDFGFAPNPFEGTCSLATCKPVIRRVAKKGDWIAGFGGANTPFAKKMIFLMRVDDICTFDQYWENPDYKNKRPSFNGRFSSCYGDNVYHHIDGKWTQENSHHSLPDGNINYKNLTHDTQSDRVLLSTHYWYFGDQAIELPAEFSDIIYSGRGHKNIGSDRCKALVNWLEQTYTIGQQGFPCKWLESDNFIRYEGEKSVSKYKKKYKNNKSV